MMKAEKNIKFQARRSLSAGNWSLALGCLSVMMIAFLVVFCLYYSLLFGFNALNTSTYQIKKSKVLLGLIINTLSVLMVFGISPITSGFSRLCYNIAVYNRCSPDDLLFYFTSPKRYFTALGVISAKLLAFFLACVCFSLPGITFITIGGTFADGEQIKLALNIIGGVLSALGITLAVMYNFRFFLSDFVMAEYGNYGFKAVISETLKTSKGHTKDIAKLFISFVFWILLCFFVLPVFYVVPYMGVSFGTSAKWLIRLKREA